MVLFKNFSHRLTSVTSRGKDTCHLSKHRWHSLLSSLPSSTEIMKFQPNLNHIITSLLFPVHSRSSKIDPGSFLYHFYRSCITRPYRIVHEWSCDGDHSFMH